MNAEEIRRLEASSDEEDVLSVVSDRSEDDRSETPTPTAMDILMRENAYQKEKMDQMQRTIDALTSTIQELNESIKGLKKQLEEQARKQENSTAVDSDFTTVKSKRNREDKASPIKEPPAKKQMPGNRYEVLAIEDNMDTTENDEENFRVPTPPPTQETKKPARSQTIRKENIKTPAQTKKPPTSAPPKEQPKNNTVIPDKQTPSTSAGPENQSNKTNVSSDKQIPAIQLKCAMRWMPLSRYLLANGMPYSKAQSNKEGIKITPATEDSYRNMTAYFRKKDYPYYTHGLRSEKQARVVIKGLPTEIDEEDILQELTDLGFEPAQITRMRSRQMRRPLHMVLVTAPMQHKESLMRLTRLGGLVVRVEAQRAPTVKTQCHRCQDFGHTQTYCNVRPRCVKCGQQHRATDCKLQDGEDPTCANCGGAHPASYVGCVKFPKLERREVTPAGRNVVVKGRTFAQSTQASKSREPWPALPGSAAPEARPPTAKRQGVAANAGSRQELLDLLEGGDTLAKIEQFLKIRAELKAMFG